MYEEIAKDEWMKCKKLFGFREISDLTMEWWFSELDTDQSGTIDEQEFYLLCETMLYEVKEKKESNAGGLLDAVGRRTRRSNTLKDAVKTLGLGGGLFLN